MATALITLESSTGTIVPTASLTLNAGEGMVILDNFNTYSIPQSKLILNSDFESGGDGTLTVVEGKTVDSNNLEIIITAWDVELPGGIKTGTHTLHVHGAKS